MLASTPQDFDFLIGDWRVEHLRLRERLADCDAWQAFEGRCAMRPMLGGAGNVDDHWMDLPAGPYRGAALRTFDPASRSWSIWWIDARDPHRLDVPVVGGFEEGVGSFYADEEIQGRPVRVRFQWLDTQTATPRWEQAFSPDGGASWEVNWKMRFVRD